MSGYDGYYGTDISDGGISFTGTDKKVDGVTTDAFLYFESKKGSDNQ
jgi:hypothetical protein